MSIEKFAFDMYDIGDRMLEGVMTNVTVNTETSEIIIEYEDQDARNYVESRGAPGTADYWLNEAKEMLETEHNWENWVC